MLSSVSHPNFQPAPALANEAIVIAPGAGHFLYRDSAFPDLPITVFTYRPQARAETLRVVFIQHGFTRNGEDYRNFWVPAADRYSLLIIAPTFDNEQFPTTDNYNDGAHSRLPARAARAQDLTYAILPRLWEQLLKSGVRSNDAPILFGHSAGGQFSHRLLATQGCGPFKAVLPANPGWYTLPSMDLPFPEGLGGIGLDDQAVERWLAAPMHIFAGDQDIGHDPNLPGHPAALRQGSTRFERAQFMMRFAREEALRRGVPCNWQITIVPGVGHDAAAMSHAAAKWLFGDGTSATSNQNYVFQGSSRA